MFTQDKDGPVEQGTDTLSVQDMVAGGHSLATAVKAELERRESSLAAWCRAGGHNYSNTSGVLRGTADSPYHSIRDALCKAFGLERDWLDAHLSAL